VNVLRLSNFWSLQSIQCLSSVNNICIGSSAVDGNLLYAMGVCIFLGNNATWIIGFCGWGTKSFVSSVFDFTAVSTTGDGSVVFQAGDGAILRYVPYHRCLRLFQVHQWLLCFSNESLRFHFPDVTFEPASIRDVGILGSRESGTFPLSKVAWESTAFDELTALPARSLDSNSANFVFPDSNFHDSARPNSVSAHSISFGSASFDSGSGDSDRASSNSISSDSVSPHSVSRSSDSFGSNARDSQDSRNIETTSRSDGGDNGRQSSGSGLPLGIIAVGVGWAGLGCCCHCCRSRNHCLPKPHKEWFGFGFLSVRWWTIAQREHGDGH
jgi:hypothetical protein